MKTHRRLGIGRSISTSIAARPPPPRRAPPPPPGRRSTRRSRLRPGTPPATSADAARHRRRPSGRGGSQAVAAEAPRAGRAARGTPGCSLGTARPAPRRRPGTWGSRRGRRWPAASPALAAARSLPWGRRIASGPWPWPDLVGTPLRVWIGLEEDARERKRRGKREERIDRVGFGTQASNRGWGGRGEDGEGERVTRVKGSG